MAEQGSKIEIRVPELGESVLDATVGRWMKQPGEAVKAGEPVVELETDKVNLEVSATADGVLAEITRPEQEDVKVGDVLGTIEKGGTAASPQPAAPEPTAAETAEKTAEPTSQVQAEQAEPDARPAASSPAPAANATPVALRMIQESGLDAAQLKGSGPGGRITKEDVEAAQAQPRPAPAGETDKPAALAEPAQAQAQPATQAAGSASANGRSEERIKMSRRRRTIAARLVEAQQTAAMLTTFNEIDMTAVMDLRERRNDDFQKRHEVKIGFTSFFVKASIGALKAFPRLNAEIQGDEMVLKHYYDIGVAVGAEEGLVVPVLHDADRLSFAAIEQRVKELAQKVRDNKLALEDLRGGTFTITNGGVFGSLLSTPILMPPQVGILGLHKIEPRPVAVGEKVAVRPMMYVALSYDHRIVDGREAVQFLVRIKELVEDPETLLLEG